MTRTECTTLRDAQKYAWSKVSDGRMATYEIADPNLDRRLETGRDDRFVMLYAPRNPKDTWNSGEDQLDRRSTSGSAQEWIESEFQIE